MVFNDATNANVPFQLTAARRRLVDRAERLDQKDYVSTHSRPKAAGRIQRTQTQQPECFNSQPPEGGWASKTAPIAPFICFNSQPPEGGWLEKPKTATPARSFNSQPPEGGWTVNQ